MRKIKVLYISHSPYFYGAESCLATLVQRLDRERFEPVVVLPDEGPLKDRLEHLGVKFYLYRAEWWARNEGRLVIDTHPVLERIQKLVEIVDQEKPDIIHSNTSVVWDGALAAELTGTRHIWHIHEFLLDHPSITPIIPLPLLYKAIELFSEKVVLVSSEAKQEMAEFLPLEKVVTIHNGIDGSLYKSRKKTALRDELGFAADDIVALTVASLRKYKGIDTLIECAARLKDNVIKLKFVVAGKGPDETVAELRQKIKDRGLQDTLYLLGHRTDVPSLLAGSDLFVLPSVKEAFPLVVLEAMASGKPVVATDCGGTAEMIVDGASGFVVPVNDPDALASKVLEVAARPKAVSAMGRMALKLFRANYEADVYAQKFEDLYRDVLSNPKGIQVREQSPALFGSFLEAYQNYLNGLRDLGEQGKSLSAKDEQITQQAALISGLRREVEDAKKVTSALSDEAREQQRLLVDSSKAIADRDLKLAESSASNSACQELLRVVREEKAQLSRQVTEKESLINDAREQLAQSVNLQNVLEDELRKKSEDLAKKGECLDATRLTLAERDGELTDTRNSLLQREGELADTRNTLLQRDEDLRSTRADLDLSKSLGAELGIRLQEKAAESAQRGKRVADLEQELSRERKQALETQRQVEKKMALLDQELAQRNHLLDQLNKELTQLAQEKNAERIKLERAIVEREEHIQAIFNSKSWRLTAPLRKALDILSKR